MREYRAVNVETFLSDQERAERDGWLGRMKRAAIKRHEYYAGQFAQRLVQAVRPALERARFVYDENGRRKRRVKARPRVYSRSYFTQKRQGKLI